jgi:hypothetical protein
MNESSPSRSSNKLLEYTSSIKTTISSTNIISASETAHTHSSFDLLSQPQDCLKLTVDDVSSDCHCRRLERDLRRLDIDTNQQRSSLKKNPLDRAESISLPTTPMEQMSSAIHQKHNRLVLEHVKNNNEQQTMNLTLPIDDIRQLMTDESMLDSAK